MVVVDPRLANADGAALCERLRTILEPIDADAAVIDVGALTDPDVGTVDALARVLLTGRRLGRDVRLRHVSRRLRELLALVGLDEVVSLEDRSGREAQRQTEEGEHPRRVEERVELTDPAV